MSSPPIEFGTVTAVYDGGRYDITIGDRPYPYSQLGASDPRALFAVGQDATVVHAGRLPFILATSGGSLAATRSGQGTAYPNPTAVVVATRTSWPWHQGQAEMSAQGIFEVPLWVPSGSSTNSSEVAPISSLGTLQEFLAANDLSTGTSVATWLETFLNPGSSTQALTLRQVAINGAVLNTVTLGTIGKQTATVTGGGSRHAWVLPDQNLLLIACPVVGTVPQSDQNKFWVFDLLTDVLVGPYTIPLGTLSTSRKSFLGASAWNNFLTIPSYQYQLDPTAGTVKISTVDYRMDTGTVDAFALGANRQLSDAWSWTPGSTSLLAGGGGVVFPMSCIAGRFLQNLTAASSEAFPFGLSDGTYWHWSGNGFLPNAVIGPGSVGKGVYPSAVDTHLIAFDPGSGRVKADLHAEYVASSLPVIYDANSMAVVDSTFPTQFRSATIADLFPFSGGAKPTADNAYPGANSSGSVVPAVGDIYYTLYQGYTVSVTYGGWVTHAVTPGSVSGGSADAAVTAADMQGSGGYGDYGGAIYSGLPTPSVSAPTCTESPSYYYSRQADIRNDPAGVGLTPGVVRPGWQADEFFVYGRIPNSSMPSFATCFPLLEANTAYGTLNSSNQVVDTSAVRTFNPVASYAAGDLSGGVNGLTSSTVGGVVCDSTGRAYVAELVPESFLYTGCAYCGGVGVLSGRPNLHETCPNGYLAVGARIVESVITFKDTIFKAMNMRSQLRIADSSGSTTTLDISQRLAGDIFVEAANNPYFGSFSSVVTSTPGTAAYPVVDQIWALLPVVWQDASGAQHTALGVLRDIRDAITRESRPKLEVYSVTGTGGSSTATLLGQYECSDTTLMTNGVEYVSDNRAVVPVLKADFDAGGAPYFMVFVAAKNRSTSAVTIRYTCVPLTLAGTVASPQLTTWASSAATGPNTLAEVQFLRIVNGVIAWPSTNGVVNYANTP